MKSVRSIAALLLLPVLANAQALQPDSQVRINEHGEVFKVVGSEEFRIVGAVGRVADSQCALPFQGVVLQTGDNLALAFGNTNDCLNVDARIELLDDLESRFLEVFVRDSGGARPLGAPRGAAGSAVPFHGIMVSPSRILETAASPLLFVDPAPECSDFLREDGLPVLKPEGGLDPFSRAVVASSRGTSPRMPPSAEVAGRLYADLDAPVRDGLRRGLTLDEAIGQVVSRRLGD